MICRLTSGFLFGIMDSDLVSKRALRNRRLLTDGFCLRYAVKEGVYSEADAARQYSITKCKISAASYRRRGLFASMTRLRPLVKILREFLFRAAKERKP